MTSPDPRSDLHGPSSNTVTPSLTPSLTPPTPLSDKCHPHLVDHILKLVTDYDTRLAIRSVSHRFKKVVDRKLFNHVALVVLPVPTAASTSGKLRWKFSMVMREPYSPFRYLPWLPKHLDATAATYGEGGIGVRFDWPHEFTTSWAGATPSSSASSSPASSSSVSSNDSYTPADHSSWPCPTILDYYGVAPHIADYNHRRDSLPGLKILRTAQRFPTFHRPFASRALSPRLQTFFPRLKASSRIGSDLPGPRRPRLRSLIVVGRTRAAARRNGGSAGETAVARTPRHSSTSSHLPHRIWNTPPIL